MLGGCAGEGLFAGDEIREVRSLLKECGWIWSVKAKMVRERHGASSFKGGRNDRQSLSSRQAKILFLSPPLHLNGGRIQASTGLFFAERGLKVED